jgi:hypothetical protein
MSGEEGASQVIVGRLVARGLDDELAGTAYAVIDGVDGRVHHVRLPDLDAATDAVPGGIVELRRFEDASAGSAFALAAPICRSRRRSRPPGATWLDRQLLGRHPAALTSNGFGG